MADFVALLPKQTAAKTRYHPNAVGETGMPYVNIKITRDGVSAEKKAELIAGVTKLLADVLGKNPATTTVIIDEIDTDNWGLGGETVTARRKR
jgi:4-oxalocrotonate tautomerase